MMATAKEHAKIVGFRDGGVFARGLRRQSGSELPHSKGTSWREKIARRAEGRDGSWWREKMERRAAWQWRATAAWKNAQA